MAAAKVCLLMGRLCVWLGGGWGGGGCWRAGGGLLRQQEGEGQEGEFMA